MIFQSVFSPIAYSSLMPDIQNQIVEPSTETVQQELITIPAVPGYELLSNIVLWNDHQIEIFTQMHQSPELNLLVR